MVYKYYYREAITDELEIEDIGNCSLIAYNDLGMYYILIIKTDLGLTQIFTEGPLISDYVLPKNVVCSFKRIDYNASKISKEINGFLNNPASKITSVIEVSIDEALEKCRSIVDYFKNPESF